jgi:hypothetical protein
VLAFVVLSLGAAQGQRSPMPSRLGVDQGGRFRRIAPELAGFAARTKSPNQRVDVIVQFRQSPTRSHYQRMANLGGLRGRSLDLVRGGVFNLPVNAIQALANDPDVLYLAPNRPVQMTGADEYEAQWVEMRPKAMAGTALA